MEGQQAFGASILPPEMGILAIRGKLSLPHPAPRRGGWSTVLRRQVTVVGLWWTNDQGQAKGEAIMGRFLEPRGKSSSLSAGGGSL